VDVFGASHVLSGIAAFTRINSTLATGGLPPVTSPPSDVTPGVQVTSVAAVGATGIVTATFAEQPATGDVYIVYTTPAISTGATPQKSDYRIAGVVTGAPATLAYPITPTGINPKLVFGADNKIGVLVDAIGTNGLVQSTTKFEIVAA